MNNNNELYDNSKAYNKPRYIIITAIICIILTSLIAVYRFPRYTESAKYIGRIIISIADGCFVSGVIVGGLGILVLVSGEGFFDLLVYGTGILLKSFTKNKSHESFIDYKQRKESERGNVKIWFIAAVGILFIVLGIICSIIAPKI